MKFLCFKIILSFCSLISLAYGEASSKNFPKGCEIKDFVFYQNRLVLNRSGTQTFYLIHNISNQEIELKHLQSEPLSPSLSIKLSSLKWGAFATRIQDLQFQCFLKEKENDIKAVDCSVVLEICQYPRVKFALSNQGSYWVSANKLREQVISDSTQQGIYLRW